MKKLMKGFLVLFLVFTSVGCGSTETDEGKNDATMNMDDLVEPEPQSEYVTVEFEDLYRHPKDYEGLTLIVKGFITPSIEPRTLCVVDSTFNKEMKLNINDNMIDAALDLMPNSRVNIYGTLRLKDGIYSIDVLDIEHFTSLRSEQYWYGATLITGGSDIYEIENNLGVDKDFEVLGTVVTVNGYAGIFVDGFGLFIKIPVFQNDDAIKNKLVKLLFKRPTFDDTTHQYTAVAVEYEIID